ncbi:MAG TPA: adenylate/guanylate cyclase domain-containing protein [bacterium]|nr:adenylate/guanylate cyclase domain-containing protein [bacterium]
MALFENKSPFQVQQKDLNTWYLALMLGTAGVCFYFTQDWKASAGVALVSAVIFFLAWRFIRWKIQLGFFIELQSFLLRSKILPEDYKIVRQASPLTLEKTKQELMDIASQQFQDSQKKLTETRHVLDKFVGTKASAFATQKGKQAVWEGELTRAIVLFSDVRGFTNMSEKLRPQETVRYLNRMFTEFDEAITFSGGEINKFMGDALMAFFPLTTESAEQSVKKAILAALRMQDLFHQVQMTFKEHYSETVQTGLGVGMAGGDVVIGNLGSARRMEFTLIGDTVNMASRLCSIAEDGQILINQDLALIAGEQFRMEALEPVRIKGKSGTHRPYSVMGERLQPGLA